MQSYVLSSFIIFADSLDPAKVAAEVGISPSNSWRKGDRIANTHLVRKESAMCVQGRQHDTLESSVAELIAMLSPHVARIVSALNAHGAQAEISVAAYAIDGVPPLSLTRDTLDGIASLHAAVDIDVILMLGPEYR